ncbi:MAG: hypothetical protein KKC03_10555 [Bacteroidetes bacterium]|nr:hypothetical protein [Bacteroidota bacterium]
MKKILFLSLLFCVSSLIYSQKPTEKTKKEKKTTAQRDTIRIANDSLEYEIIIMEIGFQNWLATQRPESYYSLNFLENRNRIYVQNYNQRVLNPQRYNPDLYFQQINYDPRIHYGKEVNYLLFMYFQFFERQYKQNLRYN